MTRRSFLKRGLFGGFVLALGGSTGLALWPSRTDYRPRRALKLLDERRFSVLAAIAARTVRAPGADPVEIAPLSEQPLALAPKESQADFLKLLGLFENALPGLLFDGRARPFTRLSPEA